MPKRLTAEELAEIPNIPGKYKEAIEYAIWDAIADSPPSDNIWSEYFRAAMVEELLDFELSDDDHMCENEFGEECVWFLEGWNAFVSFVVSNATDRLNDS